jgi:hypothetical protein
MFKKNSFIVEVFSREARFLGTNAASFTLSLALIFFLAACRTIAPLPPANLSAPGWTVRAGQAVWRSKKSAPEITGQLLVATNPDGRSFTEFTITPFPIIVAQTASNSWQIHDVRNNRTFAARGNPPSRVVWLQLPRCLTSTPPTKAWTWKHSSDGSFSLHNVSTGETLDGFLNP